MMHRLLLCCFLLFSIATLSFAQTSLSGKVTDKDSKEPITYGSVQLLKNGVLLTGVDSDDRGNFNFPDIDPGNYDVEVFLIGYKPSRIANIKVLAGKANKVEVELESQGGIVLDAVTITQYRTPLIEQDNTTSGAVITSDQIRNLPSRNINALASTAAGLASSDEGGAITVRGSRPTNTDYIIDGIRVRGSLIPESEIEQLQIITGGMEAQYGDVTGGIISITTKGPASAFSAGAEIESSKYLDKFSNTLAGINLSGPFIKNKKGHSVLGYRFSGRYTDFLDDNPSAVPLYRVKPGKLAELEANPIRRLNTTTYLPNADFLTNADVDALVAHPNERLRRVDVTGKLDFRLNKAIDLSLSGSIVDRENQFTPDNIYDTENSADFNLMNTQNNPINNTGTYRGVFRFRHRLSAMQGNQNANKSIVQNASYTLQFGFEKTKSDDADLRHGQNYFNYGHVGKFDIEWIPSFNLVFDRATQESILQHTDYRQVLRGYTPGSVNPVLANYNNSIGITPNETINSQIGRLFIPADQDNEALLTLAKFIAPNGQISNIYTNSWGFHSNVGTVYNRAAYSAGDLYTFNGRVNFDLVPGNSDRGRHNIQLGFIYEQRNDRAYSVAPRNLWNIARQQANNHILGIVEGAATVGTISDTINGQAITLNLREVSIAQNEDSKFYRSVRAAKKIPLNQYVNVDGMDPSELSLSMFSAKELNDQGIIQYYGYDYVGNPFNGTFNDFFTATDAEGIRTFPVAPNRPIYSAFYIQDKFTFRDIIFRLGVRVDRYDANTKVLKDPYSLYEIIGASEYHDQFGGSRPGNIGDDYKVYLNDAGTNIEAYRDGDQWYRPNGSPVNSPIEIFSGGLVFPKYKDENASKISNYIKSRDFNPEASFEDYKAQINIMPRLAFSFPISEDANFFAHYDILVQRPATNTVATGLDYFYFTDRASDIKNNPNLKPERTTDYEVGFQQRLSVSSKLKLSAYYKEIRDWIQLRTYFPVPLIGQYTTYDNLDFGTIKGFSFEYELRRTGNATLNANYTLQFADGTGSNSNSQRGLTSRGNLRKLFPLDYDERHRINLNFDYRFDKEQSRIPKLLENTGLNFQTVAVSGRPYTAKVTPLELGGTQTVGSINGARKPWTFTLNARVDKTFSFSKGAGLNVYCRVSNILNRQNIINVYSATGSPTDDGFLESSNGQDKLRNIQNSARQVESYLASYQWTIISPNFYSLPRRIYVGAIYNF